MIQVNELRIGNKIQDEHGSIFDVVGIGDNWVTADFDGNEGDVWEFDYKNGSPYPIPLTEEILFKCGFVQENGMMSYVVPDYSDVKICYETLADFYRLYPYTYKIKYLHQIQNLFYALTGQELEVRI